MIVVVFMYKQKKPITRLRLLNSRSIIFFVSLIYKQYSIIYFAIFQSTKYLIFFVDNKFLIILYNSFFAIVISFF